MDIWKYYDGDLKYPDLIKHTEEKEIAKTNPKWAYEYLYTNANDKSEELELIIAKDAKYSYRYAVYNLNHKPFKLGEPAIAKDEFYANEYTQYILKKDFYLDGKLICKYEG